MKNIILIGLPGSGKGTQAHIVGYKFGFFIVSTGALLRQEVANKTALGLKLDTFLGQGKLVPDELILELLFKVLQENRDKNIIFDGFPRNLSQAALLDNYLASEHKKIDGVIELQVGEEILSQRILQRYTCTKCEASYTNIESEKFVCIYCHNNQFIRRSDDKIQVLSKRIKVYKDEIEAIKKYYKEHNILYEVNGALPIEEVTKRLGEIVTAIQNT